MRQGSLNVIDIFCGAGGLSLGFELAGFNVLLGIDSDEKCVKTYSSNLHNKGIIKDVRRIKDVEKFVEKNAGSNEIHVVIGGPPCQTYSITGRIKLRSLGRNPQKDPRNGLWKWFMKFVKELNPLFFVMENVPAMASIKCNGSLLPDQVVREAKELGYIAKWRILNAADYGVPQTRRRLFIVGSKLNVPFHWPEKTVSTYVTVWEAISDLPIIPHGFRENEIPYSPRSKLSSYQSWARTGANDVLYNHVTRWHREEDLLIFSILPEGGKYTDVPKWLRRYRDDIFKDRYKKLMRDAPSWTIDAHAAKDTYRYIYPSRPNQPEPPRTISVREAARLQSFPDKFVFPSELTHAFRQIGNSVPPLLAWAVANSVMKSFKHFRGSKRHGNK